MICDDFGTSVLPCTYTGALTWADQGVMRPSPMHGVPAHFTADTPEAKAKHAESARAFHEVERNCNTCAHLRRVPHAKCSAGFLYGKCASEPKDHPYPIRDGVMMFHPHDWMGMGCYASRWDDAANRSASRPV